MKRHRLLIYCLGVLLMSGCDGPGQSAGVVTKERPYGVHVARERSVYQAQKIQARLRAMGVAAYLVASVDSLDRCWYNVMSGAFRDSISCAAHALLLDSTFRLPHLRAVDVWTLADSIAVLHSGMSGWGSDRESRRIGANVPKVFSDLSDLAQKFPADNMFYLGRISFAVPEGVSCASKLCMDLPHGISLGDVAEVARSMVEVQYQDNLYDDRVTLSVAKLRRAAMGDGREVFEECGVARPTRYVRSYAIALNFSRRVLNAGDYANGRIEAVEYSAYRRLLGYRVGLTEENGEERAYSIVVDSECGYLFMAQSEHKDDGAMGEGLSGTLRFIIRITCFLMMLLERTLSWGVRLRSWIVATRSNGSTRPGRRRWWGIGAWGGIFSVGIRVFGRLEFLTFSRQPLRVTYMIPFTPRR